MALSTSTSLNLRLDNETSLVAQCFCDLKSLLRGVSESAFLHVDAVLRHKLFGVVFMQIEVPFRSIYESLGETSLKSLKHLWILIIFNSQQSTK